MGIADQMMNQDQGQPSDQGGQEAPGQEGGSKEDALDLQIAVLLGTRLLEDGGFDVIARAEQHSSDAGQVIGQFLMQLAQQMMESLPDGVTLSPTILLAKGGWLEQMSDYIQSHGHVPKKIMDKAEIYVASTSQQMAQNQQQQQSQPQQGDPSQGQQPQGAPAPAMPQGAM